MPLFVARCIMQVQLDSFCCHFSKFCSSHSHWSTRINLKQSSANRSKSTKLHNNQTHLFCNQHSRTASYTYQLTEKSNWTIQCFSWCSQPASTKWIVYYHSMESIRLSWEHPANQITSTLKLPTVWSKSTTFKQIWSSTPTAKQQVVKMMGALQL